MKTETVIPARLNAGDRVLWFDVPTLVEDIDVRQTHTRVKIQGKWNEFVVGSDQWFERVINPMGVKYDEDKPRFSLVPSASLKAIAQVLTYGAKKYPQADNWKRVDNARERYTDALLRHVYAWMDGESLDPESGLHHLAHAGCCVLFLLHFEAEK